jgi:hypothetical protein
MAPGGSRSLWQGRQRLYTKRTATAQPQLGPLALVIH